MSMEEILVIDLCPLKGHHEAYLVKVVKLLSQNSFFVYVSCPDNDIVSAAITKDKLVNITILDFRWSFIDKVTIKLLFCLDILLGYLNIKNIKLSSLSQLIIVKSIQNQIDKSIPVFFIHFDTIIPMIPLAVVKFFLPIKWIALYMQPSYQSASCWGKEKAVSRFHSEQIFSLPSCHGLLVLDSIYHRFFSQRFKHLKITTIPELIDSIYNYSDLADEIFKRAANRKIVSMLGFISRRRNIDLFLDVALELDESKFFIVAVGYLDRSGFLLSELENIDRRLQQLNNTYVDLNYRIPDDLEFNALICISDLVFLHYKNHPFSSNLLPKVMMLRKPVLVSKGYIMEKIVNRYHWQLATSNCPNEIAQAIQEISPNFKVDEKYFDEFSKDYSAQIFDAALLSACSINKN